MTLKTESDLVLKDECYRVVGACFEVYKEKGFGFAESIYHECLEIEFETQNIPFVSHPQLQIEYRGRLLEAKLIPDFLCYSAIILELKALERLVDVHRSQVLNYLKASNFSLGLLVNFGHCPRLEWERLARTRPIPPPQASDADFLA